MTDTADDDHDEADVDDHAEAEEPQREWEERHTAPQSPYSGRDVGVGAVVALVGVLITFGVPLLLL
jgi:hypothetical protein